MSTSTSQASSTSAVQYQVFTLEQDEADDEVSYDARMISRKEKEQRERQKRLENKSNGIEMEDEPFEPEKGTEPEYQLALEESAKVAEERLIARDVSTSHLVYSDMAVLEDWNRGVRLREPLNYYGPEALIRVPSTYTPSGLAICRLFLSEKDGVGNLIPAAGPSFSFSPPASVQSVDNAQITLYHDTRNSDPSVGSLDAEDSGDDRSQELDNEQGDFLDDDQTSEYDPDSTSDFDPDRKERDSIDPVLTVSVGHHEDILHNLELISCRKQR